MTAAGAEKGSSFAEEEQSAEQRRRGKTVTAAGGREREQFCGGEKERKEPAQATHRESAKRGGLTAGILRFAQDDRYGRGIAGAQDDSVGETG